MIFFSISPSYKITPGSTGRFITLYIKTHYISLNIFIPFKNIWYNPFHFLSYFFSLSIDMTIKVNKLGQQWLKIPVPFYYTVTW